MLSNYHSSSLLQSFFSHHGIKAATKDLTFLNTLLHHFAKLPYENLTKIIRCHQSENEMTALRLPHEVWYDYLQWGSGGTCFSLVFCLYSLLKNVGFISHPLMGDRSYGENTHCALQVKLNGKNYLADPGFLIDEAIELKTSPAPWEIKNKFNILVIEAKNEGWKVSTGTKFRYFLKNKIITWDEFEKHWLSSLHQDSSLIVTTIQNGIQLYLRNNHLRLVNNTRIQKENLEKSGQIGLLKNLNIAPQLFEDAKKLLRG